MHAAVLGHVEWIQFLRLARPPAAGEIVHADETWDEPGGGGSVAAVQLAKLAGDCAFYTALGDDELGHRARDALTALGVSVHATHQPMPQRRAITLVDAAGERTIIVLGDRLAPRARDALPWDALAQIDAVYVCAADPDAIRAARRARVVVATARILPELLRARVALDALVRSAVDPAESYHPDDLDPPPRLVVSTRGPLGGTWQRDGDPPQAFEAPTLRSPVVDTYGAGDSFAAALAYALADGMADAEAIAFAARCGAAVVTGRGPYEGQLRAGATGA